ncbi:MAG TPA: hypothetical protein DCR40_11510 [Prolixibacteraceae bacterium]|nr:hypothetical protein [Prolixibacteraceae bacterium]
MNVFYYLFKRAELINQAIVSIRNNKKWLKTKYLPYGGLQWDIFWAICWEVILQSRKAKMNNRFNHIVKSAKPVLVDFYADWCVPCRLMPSVLKEVKDDFKKHVRIIKVNVDHYPDIASSCKVRNIPALVLFQSGKIHWSGTGVQAINDITIALREIL